MSTMNGTTPSLPRPLPPPRWRNNYAVLRELDMHSIEQFWHVFGPVGPQFSLVQPWVAGYNGEAQLGHQLREPFARIWFDSSLKP